MSFQGNKCIFPRPAEHKTGKQLLITQRLPVLAQWKELLNLIYLYANSLTDLIYKETFLSWGGALLFLSTLPVLCCFGPSLQKYLPKLNFCSDFHHLSAESTRAVRETRCSFSTRRSNGICFLGRKRRCSSPTFLL